MAEAMGKINTKMCFLLIVLAFIIYGCSNEKNNFGPLRSAHNHADIKVYILGNAIDFSLPQYQLQDKLTHFENWDGDVVHTHATGITLGYIFKTLGMEITEECIKTDKGSKYCSEDNAMLKVFVKNRNSDWEIISYAPNYVIQDMDKILVTYGTESEEGIKEQMESVTDKAKESSMPKG